MTNPATTAPAARMLTPAQVGRLTNLSRAAVYRAIERGELGASRLCGRLRVDPEELEAWKRRNLGHRELKTTRPPNSIASPRPTKLTQSATPRRC